jgi:simple sugar transport system substrate-binding protein
MGKLVNKRLLRGVVAAAVTILAAAALAACGASSAASTGDTTIGFVYKLPNPYFVAMTGAVKQWAAANKVHLLVGGGKTATDTSGQIAAVQTMITDGAKAIVIAPQGPQLIPTLQRAASQHIPVVLVDTDLPTWSGKTSYVGTDNYKGAVLAGQFIRAHLKPGAKIAIGSGIPGVPTLDQRVQGVIDALKGSGISVVTQLPTQCVEDTGVSVTQDILTAHQGIQGIYYACSPPVFGGQQVIAQHNLTKKLMVVGFDGDPQEYRDIKSGSETATVAQFPRKMGIVALQLAIKASLGDKVAKQVDSGQAIVSKANVAQYNGWQ